MNDPKRSPLDQVHRDSGGRFAPFAGWEMPFKYDSVLNEHRAVREAVGQFDISYLGQLLVEGESAREWLNGLLSNDVAALEDGQGQHTFLLNTEGGVIDALILYRITDHCYFLVLNAASLKASLSWLEAHAREEVSLRDESESWAGIAVQGPKAVDIFSRVFGGRTLPSHSGIDVLSLDGQTVRICRTGYTGEDGFEFFCSKGAAERWWEEFSEAGAKPCGLGARDSLRLEKCFPLNGAELTPERTPLEAGLGCFVKLEKGDFVGSEVLLKQKENPPEERLTALLCSEKGGQPGAGDSVLDEKGALLGTLTSGVLSPCLGLGIALGYLPRTASEVGSEVWIQVGDKKMKAEVVKKPFVA